MENHYHVRFTKRFNHNYKKILKRNFSLALQIDAVIEKMAIDPFQPGLKTHKANIKNYGELQSTRVSGNIRIAWDFIDGKTTILTVTVGGHEIYK